MAIYHCSVQIIGRSSGRSAIACAAYRAGDKLHDEETGKLQDYSRKSGVIYSEIALPKNAPESYRDRETLWNAVQRVEKQGNAQLAREVEIALPKELSIGQQIDAVSGYVKMTFVKDGMCADWAIHDKGDGNPHAHIMLTTRPIKANGEWGAKEKKVYKLDENGERIPVIDKVTGKQKLGKNNRKMWERETVQANDWNDRSKVEEWRAAWADVCNWYLSMGNVKDRIDHRSYARQGVEQEPTIHEGYAARQMEKRGEVSERCQENREIQQRNSLLKMLHDALKAIAAQIQALVMTRGFGISTMRQGMAPKGSTRPVQPIRQARTLPKAEKPVREAPGAIKKPLVPYQPKPPERISIWKQIEAIREEQKTVAAAAHLSLEELAAQIYDLACEYDPQGMMGYDREDEIRLSVDLIAKGDTEDFADLLKEIQTYGGAEEMISKAELLLEKLEEYATEPRQRDERSYDDDDELGL